MKKLFSTLLIGGLIGAMAFMSSCTKEYIQTDPPPDPSVPVSYSMDMQPFFDAQCISCHGSVSPNLESPGSYDNLIQEGQIDLATPENSLLYTKINVGGTMEAYANSAQRQMTLLWIQQGALNN